MWGQKLYSTWAQESTHINIWILKSSLNTKVFIPSPKWLWHRQSTWYQFLLISLCFCRRWEDFETWPLICMHRSLQPPDLTERNCVSSFSVSFFLYPYTHNLKEQKSIPSLNCEIISFIHVQWVYWVVAHMKAIPYWCLLFIFHDFITSIFFKNVIPLFLKCLNPIFQK
mgnify:CR=1 FL=1